MPLLDTVNWTFSSPFSVGRSGVRLFDCRKHHWYPATFIPEIPYTLIEVLTEPGAIVYDPFAGIGTTVFQALMLGRVPYAADSSAIAVELMRSMWTLFRPTTERNRRALHRFIESVQSGFDVKVDYARDCAGRVAGTARLRPWYSPATFNQIAFLIRTEAQCRDKWARAAARIALSATLKASCAQDRGWGCIADNMLPRRDQMRTSRDAIGRFIRNVTTLARDVEAAHAALPQRSRRLLLLHDAESHVAHVDARQGGFLGDECVDLIVTSPPYPNMTDYSTAQRLSYYWMGADPAPDLAREIGARRRRFRPSSLELYREEMASALTQIIRKLRPEGYACFVMPGFASDTQNNIVRRRAIDESLSALSQSGLVLQREITRLLPKRRRHHNQRWATLEREQIMVYRKGT